MDSLSGYLTWTTCLVVSVTAPYEEDKDTEAAHGPNSSTQPRRRGKTTGYRSPPPLLFSPHGVGLTCCTCPSFGLDLCSLPRYPS